MDNNESSELPPQIEDKKRHGCLSVILILMIFGSAITAFGNFSAASNDDELNPILMTLPSWVLPALGIFSLINIVSSFAIFKWKKWGFWLYALMAFFTLCINLYVGLGIVQYLLGLTGVAILYGVLQIGGDKKGWSQLD